MKAPETSLRSAITGYSESLILALLGNDLNRAQVIADGGSVDIAKVAELSERHRISPTVFHRLARLTLPDQHEVAVQKQARRLALAAAAIQMQVRHELQLVTKLLRDAGVDNLLLKGPAVSRDPLRRFNDLDLLIREETLRRAVVALESAGYRYKGSSVLSGKEKESPFRSASWNNQFAYRSPRSQLCVEVHTNLFERDRIRLEGIASLLDGIELFWEGRHWDDELQCHLPARACTVALLCVHSALKRSPAHNTFILRHSYDIAGLLAEGVDEKRFLHLCDTWNIDYYAYVALRLTADLVGSEPADRLCQRLALGIPKRKFQLAQVHLNCFRGLGDASLFYRYLYALLMPAAIGGGGRKNVRWYREIFFPPRWRQEGVHGVPRSSPLILLTYLYGPFVRLYRTISRRLRKRGGKDG